MDSSGHITKIQASSAAREVNVLVCESGTRWGDVARRFLGPRSFWGPDQDPDSGAHFIVRPTEHTKVRSAIGGVTDVVILWEVLPQNVSAIALTVAQIGVGRSDVLQIAAVAADHAGQVNGLSLRLQELGVEATCPSPEAFFPIARLIRRRFAAPNPTV